ncbi:hypothetical protein AWW72_00955 [Acinetobacter sp. NRRL B-65365]|uniref:DUF4062 domain-containing protein n=1 Tax=Acinetobacter sp. NRRL B-65365 TaxID=1785092 RepID=UPI0007A09744|nr:DUF4062 domain-containing protein [Acinetobacter sp. NRRL B-65365]KYQ85511.1 hypothetical protein AWW72_00955 [Acinetobacter sp. NRRL B-65365]
MSQDKKYQVFISSTYNDLIEAREKATKVILDLYHLPVGMEMFSADDDDQWKIITDAIDVSDYYVLIIGHRYGSLNNNGISYTEKEFNYAKSKKIPIISFIRERDVAVSNSHRETVPESLIKLDKFIEKAKNGKMCAFWTDVSDLERQIAVALPKSFARHKGVGWIRGDTKSEHIAEEIAKLSEENRKLREENERLKQSVSTKRPILKVSVNGINNIEYDEGDTIEIRWKKLREDYFYIKPEKRIKNLGLKKTNDYSSSALLIGFSKVDDFIDEYNNDIDSVTDDILKQHHIALRDYNFIEMENGRLSIDVSNLGNVIASKVSIEIRFPSFVFIVDDDSMENLKYYKNELDQLIVGHIETPEERHKRFFSPTLSMNNISYIPDFPIEHPYKKSNSQTVIFEFDSLLHSRGISKKNISILPKSLGEGTIYVNIMCSEYEEPVYFEIPLQVVE